jgi:hypothetical protein
MKKLFTVIIMLAVMIYAQDSSKVQIRNNIDDIQKIEIVSGDTVKTIEKTIIINGKNHSGRGYSYGGYGGFMAGINIFDLSKLNESLNKHGYKEFDENLFTTGGGGCGIVRNFMIGGEGHETIAMTRSGNNDSTGTPLKYQASFKASYGMFNLGYIFYKNSNIFNFVNVGLGGSEIEMHIIENEQVEFGDLLDNPRREFILKKESFLLDLSLGANYKIGHGGYFIVGFKGGYLFDFTNEDNFNNIIDCPELNLSGAYIKVFIGGGGGLL